ncbi:MAG: molybdate ABC transporter permease subunit [Eggerthellaceae bacterium]|nr:molybdate ABC transporter permease subunit [Eggerthellaceae bacterium]
MRRIVLCIACVFAFLACPKALWADEVADVDAAPSESAAGGLQEGPSAAEMTVSADGLSASIDGCAFALNDFARASKGSNREIDGDYYGYTYLIGQKPTDLMYTVTSTDVVVYIDPAAADSVALDLSSEADLTSVRAYIEALDKANENGNSGIPAAADWHFTTQDAIELDRVVFSFNQNLTEDRAYNCVIGRDGSDVTDSSNAHYTQISHACFARLVAVQDAAIAAPPSALEQFGQFMAELDWSPLWVTLRTTLTAIVFIFVLGLAAAYLTMHASLRVRDLLDTLFTIPMVLPPTVCGFLLLLLLGKNTALGQWFNDVGFPLVFSWPATVIAATVVAFPLMYRNARGAFENLDPNMLDAARTLGWSEGRIFFRLMLPLSWSSIAAATVLAFARALGEFGATLFLAGNYLGVTRTIPIAIYFHWMNGRADIALFWVIVILIFSFIMILFINLWSQHTTRYRRGAEGQ